MFLLTLNKIWNDYDLDFNGEV